MKITFIRHGQTDFNKQGRTQGQAIDMPLNEAGIKQAEDAVSQIPEGIDLIISSRFKRALQTAEIINKTLNVPLELYEDLKELNYGSLSGKTWAEIEAETGDLDIHNKDVTAAYDYRAYGGESIQAVQERVKKFVEFVKEKYPGRNILVSTHGGIIEAVQSLYSGKEIMEAQNGAIHEFDL